MARKQKRWDDLWMHDPRSPAARDPWLRLAVGVLARAGAEAEAGDLGACAWLEGPGQLFAEAAGADAELIKNMAATWAANPAGKIVIRLIGEVA